MVLRARRLRKPVTHRTRARSRARVPSHRAPCLSPEGLALESRLVDEIGSVDRAKIRPHTPTTTMLARTTAPTRTTATLRRCARSATRIAARRDRARDRRPRTRDRRPRTRGRGNRRARRGEASDRARERTRGLTRRDGDE
jgi:hypothetical protein